MTAQKGSPEGTQVLERDGVVVVQLYGEIDAANAPGVRQQLHAALSNSSAGLVVDLTGVAYLDSRGIQFLFELGERLTMRRLPIRFVVPETSVIRRLLLLTHIDDVIPLDLTSDAAVAQILGGK